MSVHPGPFVADDVQSDDDAEREELVREWAEMVAAGERWLQRFAVIFAVALVVMMAAQAIPVFIAQSSASAPSLSLDIPVDAR